jgi:chitinase
VNQGASQTFAITPSSGYNVSSVTVDGSSQGAITTYTFANVQANHTISAAFQQQSSGEGPFGGTPAAIPGTVQAENYDTGGQGVGYNVTSINGTDNAYRSDGVDLEVTTDAGGGANLGWTAAGQWFKYTVNVATAGSYSVSFRVAAATAAVTDAFHLANSSGTNLSGSVNVPDTGAWQTWTTVTANVTLPAGQQVLTLDQDNAGWNLNYMTFGTSNGPVAAPVFSPGGGTYTSAQNVTISSATGGASIRYTTDGSTPTSTTGTSYSGAVNISSTTTLQAVAYESGFTTSPVTSATYTISTGGGGGGGPLPEHLITGYYQDFTNGAAVLRLTSVPMTYNLIAVAFATATGTPGQVTFSVDSGLSAALGGYSQAQFIADIATCKARGQHVIISVGGAGGTITVGNSASATAFANSVSSLMTTWGFEGVDLDLENGINPTFMAQALRQLSQLHPGLIITMAPQTVDVAKPTSDYLALALSIKDILTICNCQYYNSGSQFGADGNIYVEGTVDFLVALPVIQLEAGLAPSQVGLGLPSQASAGNGYVNPSVVVAALKCLDTGQPDGGKYQPPKAYPGMRGAMTWSINWDASNGYNFANTVSASFSSLP